MLTIVEMAHVEKVRLGCKVWSAEQRGQYAPVNCHYSLELLLLALVTVAVPECALDSASCSLLLQYSLLQVDTRDR